MTEEQTAAKRDVADCDELRAALGRAKALLADDIPRYPGVQGGGAANATSDNRPDIEAEIAQLEQALREAGCE